MKKFGLAAVILFLALSTAVIKNTTKQIEDELFTAKENIRVLKSEFENISLEYDYLSSAEKLLEYQSLYFEDELIQKDIKDINFGLLKILRDWGCDEHSNRNLLCECKCGNRPIIRMTALTEGSTKSCGCISGVGEDQYFNFLNDASYADQGCHFYLADLLQELIAFRVMWEQMQCKNLLLYKLISFYILQLILLYMLHNHLLHNLLWFQFFLILIL